MGPGSWLTPLIHIQSPKLPNRSQCVTPLWPPPSSTTVYDNCVEQTSLLLHISCWIKVHAAKIISATQSSVSQGSTWWCPEKTNKPGLCILHPMKHPADTTCAFQRNSYVLSKLELCVMIIIHSEVSLNPSCRVPNIQTRHRHSFAALWKSCRARLLVWCAAVSRKTQALMHKKRMCRERNLTLSSLDK